MAKVIVTKSKLIELLDTGMSRKQISEALGLPVNQVNLLIKTAGLKGRRAKKISFQFVDDSPASEYEVPPILGVGVQEQIANANLQYIQNTNNSAINAVLNAFDTGNSINVVESTNTAVPSTTLGESEEDSIEDGPLF